MLKNKRIGKFKKLTVALLFAISAMSSQFCVFASAETSNDNITVIEDSSFDCENNQTYCIPLNKNFKIEYIEDDSIITISNQNVNVGRDSDIDKGEFDIVSGQSYIYTLTKEPLYSNTGSFTYTVNYTIGNTETYPNTGYYNINITDQKITGTAPSGFSFGNSSSYIKSGDNNTVSVDTFASISFTRLIFSDLSYLINVRFVCIGDSVLQITHVVTW